MIASDAKTLADKANKLDLDKIDSDFNHVQIEIDQSAQKGDYGLDYSFVPEVDYSVVNEIRNRLIDGGFQAEISSEDEGSEKRLVLIIDWSKG